MGLSHAEGWEITGICNGIHLSIHHTSNWHCFDMPPQLGIQYVYIRECQEMDVDGRKIWVALAQSVSVPQCPEKPGIIRVKSYKQSLAIESDGKTGSKGKRLKKCDHVA